MAQVSRVTFRQIVEESRSDAAASAWERAKFASGLRHIEAKIGRHKNAQRLAEWKARAVRLALSLLPEQIHVTIDNDYQVGLLSISWKGRGRLHLPADTYLGQ